MQPPQQPQQQGPVKMTWLEIQQTTEITINNLEKELAVQRAALNTACDAVKEENAPKKPVKPAK